MSNILLLVSLVCLAGAVAAFTSTPYLPLAIPLAVRSPYVNAWLYGGNGGGNLAGQWPFFWRGQILGWTGYIRVDGKPYLWMGEPIVDVPTPTVATAFQTSLTFTSTQSIFTMQAGAINLTINFLSPIDATDLVRFSLPFSYMTVSCASTDGQEHAVQIYSDIDAEWVSWNHSQVVTWSTTVGADIVIHQSQLQSPNVYNETGDFAQWGSVYYAAPSGGTYQIDRDAVVRGQFINNGTLMNTVNSTFRGIGVDWPTFGHAFDLGAVGAQPSNPISFVIGKVRDPAVKYIVAGNTFEDRRLYFFTQYANVLDAITFFMSDYDNAVVQSNAFDAKVQSDSLQVSEDYASITAITARQVFAGAELTFGANTSDIMYFMKEICSADDIQTVDVIYPAFPAVLYVNPALVKYVMQPMFAYTATGQYPHNYSLHDMGWDYPNAIGHNDGLDESMPIEESGNMLIMSAAYIKATNDISQAVEYYGILKQWANYLVNNSLIPAFQLATDDFAGPLANQTNLAIKGLVGIAAMSQIATAVGNTADSQFFLSIAQSYVPQWQDFATSSNGTHLKLSYNEDDSWGTVYNIYNDILLGTNLFPKSVYDMQTAWYPRVAMDFGIPLDSRHEYSMTRTLYTAWVIFMSAAVTYASVRDLLIGSIARYQQAGLTEQPFPDLYNANNGSISYINFLARPVVGGHFAHLALQTLGTNGTLISSSTSPTASPSFLPTPPAASAGASATASASAGQTLTPSPLEAIYALTAIAIGFIMT